MQIYFVVVAPVLQKLESIHSDAVNYEQDFKSRTEEVYTWLFGLCIHLDFDWCQAMQLKNSKIQFTSITQNASKASENIINSI